MNQKDISQSQNSYELSSTEIKNRSLADILFLLNDFEGAYKYYKKLMIDLKVLNI